MHCAGCTEEFCARRGVQLYPRLRHLCATRIEYAAILDQRHGVVDDSVAPDVGIPDTNAPRKQHPATSVGGHFKNITKSIGISAVVGGGCSCNSLAAEMDRLGVEGCKRERCQLIKRLRINASKVRWKDKLRAIPLSVWTGLAFRINPINPIPGMFDEAVRRTENQ